MGTPVEIRPDLSGLQRGDLIFWKGHVGMMGGCNPPPPCHRVHHDDLHRTARRGRGTHSYEEFRRDHDASSGCPRSAPSEFD